MAKEVKKSAYQKAKSARSVSISQTQWKSGVAGAKGKAGRLYGPKGQRYTGTVDLGGGKTAVYKEGKRVTRAKTQGGGFTGYRAPKSSDGSSKTSTGGKITEVTTNPTYTSAGPKFGGGSGYRTPSASSPRAASAQRRGSGSARNTGAGSAFSADRARRQTAARRQGAVKKAAAYGAGVAIPVTRPAAFLSLAAETGWKIGKSAKAKGLVKGVRNWWSGY